MNFKTENYSLKDYSGVKLLTFNSLDNKEGIINCFTTRHGGVSQGHLASLNLGFRSGDLDWNVEENLRRVLQALDINSIPVYRTRQTHSTKVLFSDELCEATVDADGLILLGKPGVIVSIYADCVPIYLANFKKKIVAVIHSGWKGTVGNILSNGVNRMLELRDLTYEDLKNFKMVIGPCISQDCFETDINVAEEFVKAFNFANEYIYYKIIDNGIKKAYIDLAGIICHQALELGLQYENISKVDLCTKCNQDILFSHRGSGGKTGRMAAILAIKP